MILKVILKNNRGTDFESDRLKSPVRKSCSFV